MTVSRPVVLSGDGATGPLHLGHFAGSLEAHYRLGGAGDSMLKRELEDRLQSLIAPIRARRARFGDDRAALLSMPEQVTRDPRLLHRA